MKRLYTVCGLYVCSNLYFGPLMSKHVAVNTRNEDVLTVFIDLIIGKQT